MRRSGVYMMLEYRGVDTSDPGALKRSDVDMLSLVPAYVLSELKTGFLMGFRIYLPFLVIDVLEAMVPWAIIREFVQPIVQAAYRAAADAEDQCDLSHRARV